MTTRAALILFGLVMVLGACTAALGGCSDPDVDTPGGGQNLGQGVSHFCDRGRAVYVLDSGSYAGGLQVIPNAPECQ